MKQRLDIGIIEFGTFMTLLYIETLREDIQLLIMNIIKNDERCIMNKILNLVKLMTVFHITFL